MNKIKTFVLLLVVCSSCKTDSILDSVSGCEKAATNFSEASTAYLTTGGSDKKKCEAFVDAAKVFLDKCPSILAGDKKAAEEAVKDIKC